MTKVESLREDLVQAHARLIEALGLEKTPIVRDSAIQRFEIAFELCWKYLKAFLLEEHNAVCTSPSTCFRAAFAQGIIDDDPSGSTSQSSATTPSTPTTSPWPIMCMRTCPRLWNGLRPYSSEPRRAALVIFRVRHNSATVNEGAQAPKMELI